MRRHRYNKVALLDSHFLIIKTKFMPCRSDYMEPTAQERELSRIYSLLKEIETGEIPTSNYGNGTGRAYGNASQATLDVKTDELCNKLQSLDISKYSLEMQIWWRNHQTADRQRLNLELEKEKNDEDRKKAIAKLSPHERKLLNL